MEETTKVAIRIRLNGRIPDPDGKYRDEITQEATLEIEEGGNHPQGLRDLIAQIEEEARAIRQEFYVELNRLGGYDYRGIQ